MAGREIEVLSLNQQKPEVLPSGLRENQHRLFDWFKTTRIDSCRPCWKSFGSWCPRRFLKRFPFRGEWRWLWFVVPTWMMALVPLAGVPHHGQVRAFWERLALHDPLSPAIHIRVLLVVNGKHLWPLATIIDKHGRFKKPAENGQLYHFELSVHDRFCRNGIWEINGWGFVDNFISPTYNWLILVICILRCSITWPHPICYDFLRHAMSWAWICTEILLMATRNPVNSPLEVGSLSHYLQGFGTIPLEFLPSTVLIPFVRCAFWHHQESSEVWPVSWCSTHDRRKFCGEKNGGVFSCDRFFLRPWKLTNVPVNRGHFKRKGLSSKRYF